MKTFFADTYAFFLLLDGNERVAKLFRDSKIVTMRFQLMELHYHLIRRFGRAYADATYDRLAYYASPADDDLIKESNMFRFLHKEKNLSYVDCLGYLFSLTEGIPFLTGDKAFKDLPNVEFVR